MTSKYAKRRSARPGTRKAAKLSTERLRNRKRLQDAQFFGALAPQPAPVTPILTLADHIVAMARKKGGAA